MKRNNHFQHRILPLLLVFCMFFGLTAGLSLTAGAESRFDGASDSYTFLAAVADDDVRQIEAVYFLTLDIANSRVRVVRVPKDNAYMIGGQTQTIPAFFAASYDAAVAAGNNDPVGASMTALSDAVASVFHVLPDAAAQMKLSGLAALVNAIGGVTVTLPTAITYAPLSVSYAVGSHMWSGAEVENVFRAFLKGGDATAIANTRMKVLDSVFSQLLNSLSIGNVTTFAGLVSQNIHSDLSLADVTSLMNDLKDVPFSSCTMANLPTSDAVSWSDFSAKRTALQTLEIPLGVTAIDDFAFSGCVNLRSVVIPSSVQTIGERAFDNCLYLAAIHVESGNTAYKSVNGILFDASGETLLRYPAQAGNVCYIPAGTRRIADWAFAGCSRTSSVIIPEGVTEIGDYAFCQCTALKRVDFPTTLTTIGDSAFLMGYTLDTFTLPEGLRSIGDFAFSECLKMTQITLPDSLTFLGAWAFSRCSALTSVTMGAGLNEVPDRAFSYCPNLASVTFKGDLTRIGNSAFYSCAALTSLKSAGDTGTGVLLPQGVGEIGFGAFFGCSALTAVSLPDSVTRIGTFAFCSCSGLEQADVRGAATIGEDIFSGCKALITLRADAGTALSAYAAENEIPFVPYTYTVAFVNRDGSAISSSSYAKGAEVTVPDAPRAPGDTAGVLAFIGWDKTVVPCDGTATYIAAYLTTLAGDISNDGKVTISDAVLLRRHMAGGYSDVAVTERLDVSGDGRLTIVDVIFLRRYLAGGYGVTLK